MNREESVGKYNQSHKFYNRRFRVTAGTGCMNLTQVIFPVTFLINTQVVKIVPAEQTAVMAVIKGQLDSVVAHGFNACDDDIFFTGLKYRIAMPLNFCRRTENPEQFAGEFKALSIAVGQLQFSGTFMQVNS